MRAITNGIDLVYLPEFKRQLDLTGGKLLDKFMHAGEIKHCGGRHDSQAGIFAAKEAAIKAGLAGAGEWKELELGWGENGEPFFQTYPADSSQKAGGARLGEGSIDISVSISHDGDYATASVVVLLAPLSP